MAWPSLRLWLRKPELNILEYEPNSDSDSVSTMDLEHNLNSLTKLWKQLKIYIVSRIFSAAYLSKWIKPGAK